MNDVLHIFSIKLVLPLSRLIHLWLDSGLLPAAWHTQISRQTKKKAIKAPIQCYIETNAPFFDFYSLLTSLQQSTEDWESFVSLLFEEKLYVHDHAALTGKKSSLFQIGDKPLHVLREASLERNGKIVTLLRRYDRPCWIQHWTRIRVYNLSPPEDSERKKHSMLSPMDASVPNDEAYVDFVLVPKRSFPSLTLESPPGGEIKHRHAVLDQLYGLPLSPSSYDAAESYGGGENIFIFYNSINPKNRYLMCWLPHLRQWRILERRTYPSMAYLPRHTSMMAHYLLDYRVCATSLGRYNTPQRCITQVERWDRPRNRNVCCS